MIRPWALMLKQMGVVVATERMSEFYGNVAILSGLLAIFAATEFIDPPYTTESTMASISALAGAVAFSLLLGSVVECILMSNTVKKMSSDAAFIAFLLGERTGVAYSTYGFIAGCVFLTVEIAAITWTTHSSFVSLWGTAAMVLVLLGLLARFLRLSSYENA